MSRKQRIGILLLAAAALAAAGLCYARAARATGFLIPCIFKRLTGLSCPGCGNTHVVLSLLSLHPELSPNLLFPLEACYLVYVCAGTAKAWLRKGTLQYEPRYPAIDISVLAVLLLWWVVRNILGI